MHRKPKKVTILLLILIVSFLTYLLWHNPQGTTGPLAQHGSGAVHPLKAAVDPKNTLLLTADQCAAKFPGLNREIERAVAQGPVVLKRLKDGIPGLVQGRIKNGKLYIISASQENTLHRISAVLHSLHRAIITSPNSIPDTIFALSINDIPSPNAWSFARSDDNLSPNTPWLMPHYGTWSWPMETLGPLDEAVHRIEKVESDTKWEKKIDKAVWRGTPWFGPDWRAGLRLMLVEVGRDQEWADVQDWNHGQNNTLSIEDFCKYKYIIYAEGKSYSGRLLYHQACASIILTPPPTFLLHNTHLLRPVFSSLLPLALAPRPPAHPNKATTPPLSSYPLPETATTWPLSYPPETANVVFVQPDWADIDLVVDYLRKNPKIAEGIARRQREEMVGGGWLGEGAEVCYWRALIAAWAGVVKVDESEWEEGMRWETYSLLGSITYDELKA